MGKGGGGEPTTTTQIQKADPWSQTVPHWQQIYGDIFGQNGAYDNITTNKNPYITQGEGIAAGTLANVNENTSAGYKSAYNAITNPENQALLNNSRDQLNKITSGYYLDPKNNASLAAGYMRGLEQIGGGWDSSAVSAGRYGGDTWAMGRGQQLADLQSGLYGTELGRIDRGLAMAPGMYGQMMQPSQQLTQLGQTQMQNDMYRSGALQQLGQGIENRPFMLAGQAGQILQAPGGGTTNMFGSQMTPMYQGSPMLGALGGAAGGAYLGSQFGTSLGPGYGTAAGAVLGGLLGYYYS